MTAGDWQQVHLADAILGQMIASMHDGTFGQCP